jgi:hypothetical protein
MDLQAAAREKTVEINLMHTDYFLYSLEKIIRNFIRKNKIDFLKEFTLHFADRNTKLFRFILSSSPAGE